MIPDVLTAPDPGPARVLVVEHERGAPAALVGDWLAERGVELVVVRPYAGDDVPTTAAGTASGPVHGLVVLGGDVGANEDDRAPWLPATRALLAASVADGTPTWGICLGGQLLAAATGGEVALADTVELGLCQVQVLPAGAADLLFGALPREVGAAQFHRDGIVALPPGAVLLATSERFPHQAFRLGDSAWGVQFHPEVDAGVLEPWMSLEDDIVQASGRAPSDVLDEVRAAQGRLEDTWRPFTHAFADLVLARAAAVGGHATDRAPAGA